MSTLTHLTRLHELLDEHANEGGSLFVSPDAYRAIRSASAKPSPFSGTGGSLGTYRGVPLYVDSTMSPGQAMLISPDRTAKLSLNSQSEPTIKIRHMSERTDMIETAELLVEIDRKVAQHGGRFGSKVTCRARFKAPVYTKEFVRVDEDVFPVGEVMKPAGLIVDNMGRIIFLMELTEDDVLAFYQYAGLNLDQLEDAFPEVAWYIKDMCVRATGKQLAEFVSETQNRLYDKPALNSLVQDYLKNGRSVVADLKVAQEQDDAANFYEKTGDYGDF